MIEKRAAKIVVEERAGKVVVEERAGKVMASGARAEFFRILRAANPEPKSELEYATAYELLVAVVLSAQATDRSVNLATRSLFPKANTPAKMVALGEERLQEFVKTIGLFRTKARNVIALSRMLIDEHGGEVPRTREALEKLPGVGRKTANVILNVAFGEATMAVDTHIFRVSNRTGLAPGKDPLAVEMRLLKVVPAEFRQHAHHWLILHGRYTCLARTPKCGECPVYGPCGFGGKAQLAAPPAPKRSPLPKSVVSSPLSPSSPRRRGSSPKR